MKNVFLPMVGCLAAALVVRADYPSVYPIESHARMQPARTSPAWFTRGVIYQFKSANFTPEGTIAAATKRLPDLKELGVDIVYSIPVFMMDDCTDPRYMSKTSVANKMRKSPYCIKDFFHVDPEFGTDDDLREFVAEAHRLGMKVIMDVVYLHAGVGARVFKDYPSSARRLADGSLRPGAWRFPLFDFTSSATREYFLTNLTFLQIDYGVDGFRCDVGTAVPLDFWCEGRKRLDALKGGDFVFICEGYEPNTQVTAFDADYGWFRGETVFSGGESANRWIRHYWEDLEHNSTKGAKFVHHYENHDLAVQIKPRREATWGAAFTEQVLAWMFFGDGVPMLYSGNEIADAEDDQAWGRKCFIDWKKADAPAARERRAYVKKLIAIRKAHAAFTDGSGRLHQIWLDTSAPDDVTAFVRRADDGSFALVVQNWRDREIEVKVSWTNPPFAMPDWLMEEGDPDLTVKGSVGTELIARRATYEGEGLFKLGAYGLFASTLEKDGVRHNLDGFGGQKTGGAHRDFVTGAVSQ